MSTNAAVKSQINSDDVPLTRESLKGAMPKNRRHLVTKSLVKEMNLLVSDPESRIVFRDNIMGYCSILQDPKVKMTDYIQGIKYVSYQSMGSTNQEAWIKTFPHRYERCLRDGKDAGHIRATVACYNRNKVVTILKELAVIPTWLVNQDVYQKAINIQASLMVTAKSEMARTAAANSLLTHLKQPEVTKISLDVNVKEDDSVRELREAALELVAAQKKQIESGNMTAKDIAQGKIISGDFERLD
jgi:hypothetical protein